MHCVSLILSNNKNAQECDVEKRSALRQPVYGQVHMTAQACSGSMFHEYESLLHDDEAFERALHAAAHSAGSCGQGVASSGDNAAASGAVRLHGLFALIDVAVEMLAEAGLQHLLRVYNAVRRHASARFERCMLWHVLGNRFVSNKKRRLKLSTLFEPD